MLVRWLLVFLVPAADGYHTFAAAVPQARRGPIAPARMAQDTPPVSAFPTPLPQFASTLLPRAVALGCLTGVGVACLKLGIEGIEPIVLNPNAFWIQALPPEVISVATPMLGGLAVGALRVGTPGFDKPPKLGESLIDWSRRGVARASAAAATLGTGNSLGPEGPAVDIGRGIAARIFGGLCEERDTILVAAGVASGVAAGFSAPIAGIIFACETVAPEGGRPALQLRPLISRGWARATRALRPPEPKVRTRLPIQERFTEYGDAYASTIEPFFNPDVTVEALCDDSALLSTGTVNNAAEVRSQQDGIAVTEDGRAREKEVEAEKRLAYAQALNEMKTSEISANRISLRRARMWQASPARVTLRVAAVALSASCAALVSETILQGSLRLQSPDFTLESPLLELPFYLGLGVLAGALAILVREARTASLSVWSDEGAIGSNVPLLLRPMAAAAVVGSIGIAFPRILFNGYATLNAILANTQPEPPLSLLGYSFLKIGTTAFSLGAGLVGGVFAPSLFIGATAGAAFHSLVASATEFAATNLVSLQLSLDVVPGSWGVLPILSVAAAPAYAIVGAAATLGALFRSPMTASVLLLELTQENPSIFLPTLAAATVAEFVLATFVEAQEQKRLEALAEACELPDDIVVEVDAQDAVKPTTR